MATPTHPLPPDPGTEVERPPLPPVILPPPQEDLTQPVPLGEPPTEGYLIREEDPELAPPDSEKP